ncbi:PREDICTED: CDP-diacylglycerol--glycerol-3-phosphate 3-phosphatidyltransferase 2-like isoform X1 [Nicotiana attenuata]|uniref:CDP-diacylglycerol--glycerol-3-phosphate 1-phosphatidyltransferase n=1 Tax=Nicotiana attenuata TaxID=49451 RepID=A0A314LEZ8_NICAT|nr:PREDICTED: CDP-diacylglycerol--glycerol-3-phosphate 3-phosphatidyltransferase 2-like isoform X1 [Nicotiana attenuata]OIT39629.1 cdp-diacylglycerol--glycerol-3-phosphate 3-phosphatidyltransferase 1, chloroplastic [Nicotiana attenuata]
MPGGLKLNAVTSIYSHKPYNFFRSFTSVTGTSISAAAAVSVSPHMRRCWRGTSISVPASGDFRHRQKLLGFLGKGYANFPLRSISTTQMGPAPDHKEDDLRREKASPPPPPPSKSEKLLTLPTILTIGRVAAVPLLVSTFYVDSWWGPTATTAIFIAAAITDWLDGYLARKMNLGTAFGAFLDPVADKLMVAATLILLCTRPLESSVFGQLPWLLTVPSIAIIGREITMSAVREWAASQGGKLSEAVAVNNLGKWKTATQMTALTILLLARDSSLSGVGTLVGSGVILLYISAWLAVWSLVVYMRKIWKVLLM